MTKLGVRARVVAQKVKLPALTATSFSSTIQILAACFQPRSLLIQLGKLKLVSNGIYVSNLRNEYATVLKNKLKLQVSEIRYLVSNTVSYVDQLILSM